MLDGVMEAISRQTGVMSLSCTPKVCGVDRRAVYLKNIFLIYRRNEIENRH